MSDAEKRVQSFQKSAKGAIVENLNVLFFQRIAIVQEILLRLRVASSRATSRAYNDFRAENRVTKRRVFYNILASYHLCQHNPRENPEKRFGVMNKCLLETG
jgi:hypothetical protein